MTDDLIAKLRNEIKELHKVYGCELQDPNGTIWDHAARQTARVEKLEEALRKVDSLLEELEMCSTHDSIIVDKCWRVIEEALPDSFVV